MKAASRVFYICFAAAVALIAGALWLWGAVEVRGQFQEVLFPTLFGAFGLIFSMRLFPWLGLSVEDDVVERQNSSAVAGLGGAIFAEAMIYAGGSLGEGPSYEENIFSAALGITALFMLWALLESGGQISLSIAEERDLASGIRFCGFMVASGLILGRAIVGDWHSASNTIHDFVHDGWPAAALCFCAIVVEWFLRPNRTRPFPAWRVCGLLPALAYLAFALAWVWHLGRWEGMPA
jgi:hypothetical protein